MSMLRAALVGVCLLAAGCGGAQPSPEPGTQPEPSVGRRGLPADATKPSGPWPGWNARVTADVDRTVRTWWRALDSAYRTPANIDALRKAAHPSCRSCLAWLDRQQAREEPRKGFRTRILMIRNDPSRPTPTVNVVTRTPAGGKRTTIMAMSLRHVDGRWAIVDVKEDGRIRKRFGTMAEAWFAALDRAYERPSDLERVAALRRLGVPGCHNCNDYLEDIRRLAVQGHRAVGHVTDATAADGSCLGRGCRLYSVDVRHPTLAYQIVERKGKRVGRGAHYQPDGSVTFRYSKGKWLVCDVWDLL